MLPWTSRHTLHRAVKAHISHTRLASNETTPKKPSKWINRLRRLASTPPLHESPFSKPTRFAIYGYATFLAWHVWTSYFFTADPTYGISMQPTIASFGDWVLISKYYRRGRGVKVGDIVSFQSPLREGEYAVKRVLGLEGDFILRDTPGKSEAMIQVPQGHCWLVGDNLQHSRDSRMYGPVPLAMIHGKLIAKMSWRPGAPLDIGYIEHGLQPSEEDLD